MLALAAGRAHAGQACREEALSVDEARRAMALAERSFAALEASGASVALLARAGQDLSAYGLVYSHMGIAVRDHRAGRWTVVHALNDCGTASSDLYEDGVGNFFLTDLFRYRAQVAIPGPALQARLAAAMAGTLPRRLHEPRYNMLSYVYGTRYQNSNQWVLEVLAGAEVPAGPAVTRAAAQSWLRGHGYRPPTVHVPAAVRLGARMFRANVAFDDHPFDRRMAGSIDTVSTDAVLAWLRQRDPDARVLLIE
ncbi:DUF2145 domain-containing protein [uncultured Massilia sp.]|uniref:DUF2145 domain-containing protein n=1 Tax=uncultured Massilia sp. TaxID=169973 RepID=UPI0025EC681B|nr:DUF2145 domain-containing protein [uncultured Massilia sp.]